MLDQKQFLSRMEQERLENLRREQQRLEMERLEAERRERERLEEERRERELLEGALLHAKSSSDKNYRSKLLHLIFSATASPRTTRRRASRRRTKRT